MRERVTMSSRRIKERLLLRSWILTFVTLLQRLEEASCQSKPSQWQWSLLFEHGRQEYLCIAYKISSTDWTSLNFSWRRALVLRLTWLKFRLKSCGVLRVHPSWQSYSGTHHLLDGNDAETVDRQLSAPLARPYGLLRVALESMRMKLSSCGSSRSKWREQILQKCNNVWLFLLSLLTPAFHDDAAHKITILFLQMLLSAVVHPQLGSSSRGTLTPLRASTYIRMVGSDK